MISTRKTLYKLCQIIGERSQLQTTAKTVVGAINEDHALIQGLGSQLYPVGSYYWTSDGDFDPNTSFGGTWEKLDEGIVLTSAGTNYPISSGTAKDGGEASHTLTVNEMPYHQHGSGAVAYIGGAPYGFASLPSTGNHIAFANWITDGTGGGQPHNIMQPYKNAYCWHRTA